MRESLPHSVDLIAPGGEFLLRPPREARREMRRLLGEHGMEYVGTRRSDNDRPWMVFRKKAAG